VVIAAAADDLILTKDQMNRLMAIPPAAGDRYSDLTGVDR
jgi:hypothetical protein